MEEDGDDINPLVPHNSMIDCRTNSSRNNELQRNQKQGKNHGFRSPFSVDSQGKEAIDALKSRLYDKPENSDVFKSISRSTTGGKLTPHPPTWGSPKPNMGAFRTTMFRRDFNRIQATRAQASNQIKHPVIPPIKKNQENAVNGIRQPQQEEQSPKKISRDEETRHENTSQLKKDIESEQKVTSCRSESPISFLKDEVLSEVSSSKSTIQKMTNSAPSLSKVNIVSPHEDQNYNFASLPHSQALPENDAYLGLDIMDVIKKLRARLNRSTDLDAIAYGIDIDGDENNLMRLYIKEDDGKFLYCLPKNRGMRVVRYNPYDLECVSPIEAKSHLQYFTVTSSAITQIENEHKADMTITERWLYERRIFNRIKDMPVFGKFRMWKGFTCWKINVRFLKNTESKDGIDKLLFTNMDIFQRAILKIRGLCEDASSSLTGIGNGDEAISFLSVQPELTHTLKEFCNIQEVHIEKAKEKIFLLRKRVLEIVKVTCEGVAEKEGLIEWIYPECKKSEENKQIPVIKKITDLKELEKVRDKEKERQPSFTQISQWRTVLRRITCFIRLVDFLLLELLRRLVLVALRTLVAQVEASSTQGKTVALSLMETTEEERKQLSLKKVDSVIDRLAQDDSVANALLRVSLVLNVPEPVIKPEVTGSPKRVVSFQDAPSSESEKDDDQDSLSTMTDSTSANTNKSDSVMVVLLYPKSYITMSPSQQDFENFLFGLINLFERTVGEIPSLSRDKALSVFTNPPADDVVFALSRDLEEEEKASKVPWPDVDLLFGADPDYRNQVEKMIQFVRQESENVMNYAKNFRMFCAMVDLARRVDVDAQLKRKEWDTKQFNVILNQHTEQIHSMEEMQLFKRVGLFHVESDGFQQATLPYPRHVLDAVSRHLPVIAAKRNDALLRVVKHASNKLDKTSETVEEFVEHLIFLSRMSTEINALEREYGVVTRLYAIAKNFDMKIDAEEFALSQTLMPSFLHLKSTILYCLAKRDENIQFYSKALDDLITTVRRELRTVSNKISSPALLEADNIPQVISEKIKYIIEELDVIASKARNYSAYHERFGNSMSSTYQKKALVEGKVVGTATSGSSLSLQSEVSEIEKDLSLRKLLWQSLQEWGVLVEKWERTEFEALSMATMQKDVSRYIEIVFMLEKGLPPNKVVPRLKQKVTDFKIGMPVITSLRNPALRTRHWEAIQEEIGTRIVRDKNFTLGHLMRLKVFEHKEKIIEISSQASNEATLEQMLQKVMDLWNQTDFKLVAHATRDIAIISQADDIITSLEESQVTLTNIRSSKYVTPIKSLVEDWDRKLSLFSRTLDEWLTCQRNWMYLESIFSAADIQRQLPNEARLFSQVDKSWRDIMRRTIDKPNALKAAIAAGVLEVLQASNSHLEKIHRCLEDYLETKRLVFARFYFLSNEDLLDILANNKNPNAIQPHLRKCFYNLHYLEIVRQAHSPPQIKYMMSEEGERVNLPKTLRARGNVESWLLNVEHAMYETMKMHIKNAINDKITTEYVQWVFLHPGQAVITTSQISFTREVISCFKGIRSHDALVNMRNKLVSMLTQLSQIVTTTGLPTHKHQMLESLLTIEVHGRDILDHLIENNVNEPEDFEWARQLRYDWDDDRNACTVRHCDALFEYGYEYLGCSPRLVITPLTDRCYLTLTGALNLHLNGAPSGPAGTGKTETVKDLAKAMGKHCLVFNCSEGLDYKMMGKFFSGISQSGSWICFDEFNRIDVEVLSVIAQQLHSIKSAKDNEVTRFLFEGRDIKMNPSCGVFITMNPRYAGRVQLPDNLKALFRPVAMMVPDYAFIAEIILFSEGFVAAAMLSRKIFNLYQLASKQLSQQDHYDFGLRAIKSVLLLAGQERRNTDLNSESENLETEESYVIINAVKKSNLPKFVSSDVPLFNNILADLFPGISTPPSDNRTLRRAISLAIAELRYQSWPSQIQKVIQFHHILLVRYGIMLIGPAGGGKTATRQILQRSLVLLPSVQTREQHEKPADDVSESASGKSNMTHLLSKYRKGKVDVSRMNPKCVTLGELYGEFNQITMEWSDGLLSNAYRRFSKENTSNVNKKRNRGNQSSSRSTTPASSIRPQSARSITTPSATDEQQTEVETTNIDESAQSTFQDDGTSNEELRNWQWIIMDGPVDTQWVENLNTVLDDSKVLCLANGERINMSPGMRIIFEVDNLAMASPATVSRCGMVYMEPEELGWSPYVDSWLKNIKEIYKLPSIACEHLLALFKHTIDAGIRFMKDHSEYQHLHPPVLSLVLSICSIISGFVEIIEHHGGFVLPETKPVVESEAEGAEKTVTFADDFERELRTRRISCVKQNPAQLLGFLGKVYVFAFTWGFGGVLEASSSTEQEDEEEHRIITGSTCHSEELGIRQKFDMFVRELFTVTGKVGVALPGGDDTMFSYYIDIETGNFAKWEVLVPPIRALIAKSISEQFHSSDPMDVLEESPNTKIDSEKERFLIPTLDTIRYSFLIAMMAISNQPVLLTGQMGVGKTVLILDVLSRVCQKGGNTTNAGTILGAVFRSGGKNLVESILDVGSEGTSTSEEAEFCFEKIVFSAHTTASKVRSFVTSKLVKRGRDSLGPKPGQKMLIFMDDLNMPQPDAYSAQPPLELVRELIDSRGFYDTKKLIWKSVHEVTLLAACSPPGGGRNSLNNRLLRHFSVLNLPSPKTKMLEHIYGTQLGRYLEKVDFTEEVRKSREKIVMAAIFLYYKLSSDLLPTPAKTHYMFNLRDISKVIEGMLQAHPSVITKQEHCVQLFVHESMRIFHDRLIDDVDRGFFFNALAKTLHDAFKVKWTASFLQNIPVMFGDFMEVNNVSHTTRTYRPIQFHRAVEVLEESFERARHSWETMQHRFVFFNMAVRHITRAARVFRNPGSHMMMVGVGGTGKTTVAQLAAHIESCDFIKPVASRVYLRPEFCEDIKKAFINAGLKKENTILFLTDNIVKDMFLEDISSILSTGEVDNVFENEELEDIFCKLKGEVIRKGLQDTKKVVFRYFLRQVKKRLHVVISTSPVGPHFRQHCRLYPSLINCCTIDWYDTWPLDALHAVASTFLDNVSFDVVQINDTIAMKGSLAKTFVEIHKSVEEESKTFFEEMHRRYYTTPTSYIDYIRLFSSKLHDKASSFILNRERLTTGLLKLAESNTLVGTMRQELVHLGPELEQKAKDTEKLLEQLARDQEAVDKVHHVVQQEEEFMNQEALRVQAIADEAQHDLESVIPQLEQAISALDALDKSDISEIRVYTKPPPMVMTVLSAVCVLLQQKPDWNNAKLLLGDPGFLKSLVTYDKHGVPDKVFVRLKRYTQNPNFNPDAIGKISVACKSMCEWILSLENYNEVYKIVQPKQIRCEEAQAALRIAKENLNQKQESLNKIQKQLKILQEQYDESVRQLEHLKIKKELTIARLERASILTAALSEEQERWSNTIKNVGQFADGLIGDTVLSTAAVSYLGAFTSSYRRNLMNRWYQLCDAENIPISNDFELTGFLSEPVEIQMWLNNELPHGKTSIENAVFVKHSHRWPLLIDPQEQARKWIIANEKDNNLKVVKATDPICMKILEEAIPLGNPVLIEDVGEQLDASLEPVLNKSLSTRGNDLMISFGDNLIELNENFKLYLTTPLANPHFLPDVCIKVTIINFTVTLEGLQDQLLSRTVHLERPQLEKKRRENLQSLVKDRFKLEELEDRSLSLLHTSRGNILDDETLITTLDESVKMSHVIQTRVELAEKNEETLNLNRDKYLPVAHRGAVLYFVLNDLAQIDVMYQFSLPWFMGLFTKCLESSKVERQQSPIPPGSAGRVRPLKKGKVYPDKRMSLSQRAGFKRHTAFGQPKDEVDLPEYLKALVDLLTENVYRVVSHAIFGRHKLTFSFMLCASILKTDPQKRHEVTNKPSIDEVEWNFFLRGGAIAAIAERLEANEDDISSGPQVGDTLGQLMENRSKAPANWIPDSAWKECLQISNQLEAFAGLCTNITVNHKFWKQFSTCPDPYNLLESGKDSDQLDLPAGGGGLSHVSCKSLSAFQRLMVIKILRPECLLDAVRTFVEKELGAVYVTKLGFDLQDVYEESNSRTPLIFILSGSDPASNLLRFAKEIRGTTLHLEMISLGRGQGPKAEEAITKAYQQKGKWVFLQNCHHASSFMPRLKEIVRRISQPDTKVDPQFRMWLSSKPDPSFPVSILQAGLKMAIEPPPGIKANLLRSFAAVGGVITESQFEDTSAGPGWKRLLFGLCLFHGVVHERKKFTSSLGWNIPYQFSFSDLEVSIQMLHMLLTEHRDIPWQALWYLTGDIAYGGRVTDQWDQRCLKSILRKFYNPDVLQEDYTYTSDYVYRPPPHNISLSVCCSYIESLPASDSAELFGMDQNANHAYLKSQAKTFMEDLLLGQPSVTLTTGSTKANDDIVLEISNDIASCLPTCIEQSEKDSTKDRSMLSSSSDKRKQPKKPDYSYLRELSAQSTLLVSLGQEIQRFDRLLDVILTSLHLLRLAIKGEIVMTTALEDAFNSLLNNVVPPEWTKVSYESCKPLGAWIKNLLKRVEFFTRWLDLVKTRDSKNAEPSMVRLHPRAYWLPAFFFPQGFLTSVLQTHARMRNLPVDSLSFEFKVRKECWTSEESVHSECDIDFRKAAFQGTNCDDGVLVIGLYLDGASWDFFRGVCEAVNCQQRYPLPALHFIPYQNIETKDEQDKIDESEKFEIYECPVYKTSVRASSITTTGHPTNFVTSVKLQSLKPADHWITRGVALLCQLDE